MQAKRIIDAIYAATVVHLIDYFFIYLVFVCVCVCVCVVTGGNQN